MATLEERVTALELHAGMTSTANLSLLSSKLSATSTEVGLLRLDVEAFRTEQTAHNRTVTDQLTVIQGLLARLVGERAHDVDATETEI